MDGTVVAAMVAATGTASAGIGGVVSAVLSRKSAREAAAQAGKATSAAAGVEAQRAGYELMELSLRTAHLDIERLNRQQDEDRETHRRQTAALREDFQACDDERAGLRRENAHLRSLQNGT